MTGKVSEKYGLFVTNHLNLMFSLAYGLITPSSAFGDKHYEDTLSKYPGWIPLFIGKIPESGLEMSVREAKHLMPVIVEIDLSNIEYLNHIIFQGNKRKKKLNIAPPTLYPELCPSSHSSEPVSQNLESNSLSLGMSVVVHGTISVGRIRKISVQSDSDKKKLVSQSRLRNNVPLPCNQVKRKKTLFTNSYRKWYWRRIDERILISNIHLNMSQAAGGILAMLYHVRHNGQEIKDAYEVAFDLELETPIPGLKEWMWDGSIPNLSTPKDGNLLWCLVEKIAEQRDKCNDNDLDELVLEFLEHSSEINMDSIKPICKTLRELGGLGGKTISEYFDLHRSPLDRALILFYTHRKCQELLDFQHVGFSDRDRIYSAILFGARSGWLRLPLELRGNENLKGMVCSRMVSFCHRIAKSG